MFGYIVTYPEALSQERQQRFKAMYCGLCRTLRKRHGFLTSATLSYDLTFLALLLNALYEPGERTARERCIANPAKQHDYVLTPVMDYVADMNIALAYHKCRDDWYDDKNPISAGEAALLRRAYRSVEKTYPRRCDAIENWLVQIHGWERDNVLEIDLPVNATGRMLAELFVWPEQHAFVQELQAIGDGLGRFVYFMDAYDDLPGDVRRGSYNPLKPLRDREDYEQLCKTAMMAMVADAADAFERLPILMDADIIRNVLYSGVWSKYAYIQNKRGGQNKGA
ncbi:MAG: hypothetical protein IJH03_03790 [Clostridia bacterium]|nr:hypothetical protein [Clostridia bacterium]